MALIKRIMSVIKEELFENKNKTVANKQPKIPIENTGTFVRQARETQVLNEEKITKQKVFVKTTTKNNDKNTGTAKAKSEKNPQSAGKKSSQKTVVAKKTATKTTGNSKGTKNTGAHGGGSEKSELSVPKSLIARCKRLPFNLGEELMTVKKWVDAGNAEEALGAYNALLSSAMDEMYSILRINNNNGTKRGRMREICSNLNFASKKSKYYADLVRAVEKRGDFANMQPHELFVSIGQKITSFLDLLLLTAEKYGRVYNEHFDASKAGRKKNVNTEAKLSFKARESVAKGKKFNMDKEFPKIKTYLDSARKNRGNHKFYAALHDVRMALEVMVKAMCRKLSVSISEKEKLYDMITKLENSGKLSGGQIKILGDVRWLGNLGSHDDDKREPAESDVAKAFDKMNTVKKMFATFMEDRGAADNAPLFGTNEYYSPQRKYYGRWSHCFIYGELMMIDDYVQLKKRADEGDVEAMIDIASGFLENTICWTEESLIWMRKYKDSRYYPDPCDARYYYWILKACNAAYEDWRRGKKLPLRYLANVLLEGIKFIYMHGERYRNNSPEQIANRKSDQFVQAVTLFGDSMNIGDVQHKYIEMLTAMMTEYEEHNLFAAVHREKTIKDVQEWKIKD